MNLHLHMHTRTQLQTHTQVVILIWQVSVKFGRLPKTCNHHSIKWPYITSDTSHYITLARSNFSHGQWTFNFKCSKAPRSITSVMCVHIVLIFTSTNNEEGNPHMVFLTTYRHLHKLYGFSWRFFKLKRYSYLAIALQVYGAASGSPHDAASICLLILCTIYTANIVCLV